MSNWKAKLLALFLLGCADNPPQGYFNREREERCLSESLDFCVLKEYTYDQCLTMAYYVCGLKDSNETGK